MAIEVKARDDSVRMNENSAATEMVVLAEAAEDAESESTLVGTAESLAVELTMLVGNTIEGCTELATLERSETTEDGNPEGALEGASERGGTEEGMDDGTSEVIGGTEVGIEDGKSVDTGGRTLVTWETMLLT